MAGQDNCGIVLVCHLMLDVRLCLVVLELHFAVHLLTGLPGLCQTGLSEADTVIFKT